MCVYRWESQTPPWAAKAAGGGLKNKGKCMAACSAGNSLSALRQPLLPPGLIPCGRRSTPSAFSRKSTACPAFVPPPPPPRQHRQLLCGEAHRFGKSGRALTEGFLLSPQFTVVCLCLATFVRNSGSSGWLTRTGPAEPSVCLISLQM